MTQHSTDAIISVILIIVFAIFGLLLLNWIYSFIMYKWNAYLESKATQIHRTQQHHHVENDNDEMNRRRDDEYSMPPPSSVPRSARSRSRSRTRSRY